MEKLKGRVAAITGGGSGIGRAATMAVAYLISTGLTVDQAWALVREARPFIRPTAIQVAQIEHFAAQVGAGDEQ